MPPRKRKYKTGDDQHTSEVELASNIYFAALAAHSSDRAIDAAAAISELNQDLDQDSSALFLQAYEANILRGPQALDSARALEALPHDLGGPGDALVKLSESQAGSDSGWHWPDEDAPAGDAKCSGISSADMDLWVDRYDVRLLLEHIPIVEKASVIGNPPSPSGWTDLPSDTEDTFFFSPEETDEYRREKRRQALEHFRENRMAALRDEAEDQVRDELWGDSDEEPDEPTKAVMSKTAAHVASSPNPAQLEMRILANYGSDKRFSFLRGRWPKAWTMAKGRARMNRENENKVKTMSGTLGGLDSYGDSGSEGTESSDAETAKKRANAAESSSTDKDISTQVAEAMPTPDDDAVKEARRQRAREWSESRKRAS